MKPIYGNEIDENNEHLLAKQFSKYEPPETVTNSNLKIGMV